MIITNIQLVPSNVPFNIYSGLTSATTFTLIATNVTNNFEFNIDIFDLWDGQKITPYFYLRFVSEHCKDLIVKVTGLNVVDFTSPECVEEYMKYAEAVGLTSSGGDPEIP